MKLYICENKIFMEEVNLKIFSDIPCEVYVDNDLKAVAKKNILTKVPVRQGEYYVQLVSTVNSRYKIERVVSLDYDKVLNVQFSELVHLHPEWLRDTDVVWIRDIDKYIKAKNLVSGEIVSSAYDYVDSTKDFKNGISIVRKNNLAGVVNIRGNEILPCSFEQISRVGDTLLKVKHNGKYLLLNSQNCKKVNDHCYDDIQLFDGKSIVGYRDDGCAFLNNNGGEDLFLSQYKFSEGFINSFAIVSTVYSICDRKYGLINSAGDEVLPCIYDYIYNYRNGLKKVKKDGKYGIIDQTGHEVISCVYDALGSSLSDGLIYAKQNGKYGFINLKGEIIIPFKYDDIHDWSWYSNNDYWYRYFSESGIAIVSIKSRSNSIESKYGLVTKDGKEIFPCMFSRHPRIILKDQVCLIDNKGGLFIVYPTGQYRKLKYQDVGRIKNGLAVVKCNGLYGCVDENLNEVIPCVYEDIKICSQNSFIVYKNKRYGVVDNEGKEIIPIKYKRLEAWGNGLLKAYDMRWGVITEDGREIIPCIYNNIGCYGFHEYDECLNFFEEKMIPVERAQWGYVDLEGNEVIPCIYTRAEIFQNGIGVVYQDDQCYYIDRYGNIL